MDKEKISIIIVFILLIMLILLVVVTVQVNDIKSSIEGDLTGSAIRPSSTGGVGDRLNPGEGATSGVIGNTPTN